MLHEPGLLDEVERLSARWREPFFAVVRRGTERGQFRPVADPGEVAHRLLAMIDGLGFDCVIGYRRTSRPQLRALGAYSPGDSLDELRARHGLGEVAKLN